MLDPVAGFNPLDDPGQVILAIGLTPFLLCRGHQLVRHDQRGLCRLWQPLVFAVRCQTVAKVRSTGLEVRIGVAKVHIQDMQPAVHLSFLHRDQIIAEPGRVEQQIAPT